ncbi:MAG: hypothetical protein KME59_23290 [Trichormus sp. ATA11-4-KO1]|jgi:flagellar motor switch/type III secretory pathway protein FliN|nr:hypothetical protein [Trichormus sp. ATA11-4-KO1]
MAKRRVRLNDENDPLSSTDKVLAGFEQVSKSTSQPDEKLTSQEDKLSTIQADNIKSSQDVNNSTIQEADKPTSQPDIADFNNLKKSTSQEADQIASPQDNNSTSKQDSNPSKKQVDFPASQQVKSEKATCRKSTFQIDSEVLHLLDKLHLTLQLELGKTNAPYKEVIVEEALVRLLEEVNSDRGALISALVERQKSRDKI